MLGEHHTNLAEEFPEHKDQIHTLKTSDPHFAQLCAEYEDVANEVYRIEEQIETPSDEYTEEKKMERLKLKDEIYALLQKA